MDDQSKLRSPIHNQSIDTSNPAVLVNGELLQKFVSRRIWAIIQMQIITISFACLPMESESLVSFVWMNTSLLTEQH
ncbi:hypothetical protein Ancab_014301 [Ancistrocladus abbreviatus]